MPRCLTRISLALILLLSSEVWALGLGEVRLESALNEPLRAEIQLLSASAEELQNLTVALASAETFARYGIERPFYLQDVVFEVVRSGRADGNFVRVTSKAPITEPFLTFLVEAVWPSGRLLREYTVLLDPPTFAPPAASPSQPQVTAPSRSNQTDSGRIERTPEPSQPATSTPTPAPATRAPAPQPARSTEPQPQPVADDTPYDAAAGGDYSVGRGETLWGIASSIRPDSRLTMNQTMLAIYEANPEAFGGNINVLRAGARLRIPSADDIYRIDRSAAFAEAKRQNEAWSGNTAVTTPAPVAEPAPEPEPELQPEPEPQPSLTLVPPDEEPVGIDAGLDGETTDEPYSRENEILDRIAEIEAADVPAQQSLIEIRNNELANLRQELAEIRGEEYQPVADDPFVDDTEATSDELFPDYGEATDAETAADTAADAAQDEGPATVSRSSRRDEPSMVDTILGWATNIWVLLGLALLLVLAILVWFMRRGSDDDSTDVWGGRMDRDEVPSEELAATESLRAPSRHEESIVVVEGTGATGRHAAISETATPTIKDDEAAETGRFGSLEDTFSSETAVNLDQSDPIAEADFHMAYGLYDQAADLINGALQAEPKRQDLLTKLCEVYFVWGNRDAFVDAAQKLRAVAGENDADWDKIVIMGQQIAPDNSLFAGAGVAGATKVVDLSFDEDSSDAALDMDFGTETGSEEVIDLGASQDDDGDVDFLFEDDASEDLATEIYDDRTVEMPDDDKTVETLKADADEATGELPSIDEKIERARGGQAHSDETTEIDLDDLDLDLDGMTGTELGALQDIGDDDATELASLDDLDDPDSTGRNFALDSSEATGRNPQLDSSAATGRNPRLDVDDDDANSDTTGFAEALDIDFELPDDEPVDSSSLKLARDETGQNPAITSAEETSADIEADLLAATGRTQILSDDFAVETFSDEGQQTISDSDATLLAKSLDDDDFDFAKTEALPPGTYGDDSSLEETGQMPAVGSTDVDVDLDELTSALQQTERGDTVEQPRDDATVEQPRPGISSDEDTVETLAFSPDDMSDELNEARTMTEVGTKLDLARAYVDMGDPAGARSILEEVLDEGDAGQKQQAKQLLESLS